MSRFYVYLHCKPDGVPFYVGKGTADRAFQMFRSRRGKHHQNVVAKYGAQSIGIFIFPCASEDEAFADEIRHIRQLRDEGVVLCNKTDGGEGQSGRAGRANSGSFHAGMTPWNKGKQGVQVAWNRGICGPVSHSFGRPGTMTGRSMPVETRAKIAAGVKAANAARTPEQREAISRKLSAANKGQVSWATGKKQSPETIAKRMAASAETKRLKKLELDRNA